MADPQSPPDPAFRLGHRRWLDGLRGVAILLVLAFHVHLVRGGFLGVDLFFVLSGFLITTLLVEEWERTGTVRFGRFYLRRALRLLPALLLTFAVTLLAVLLLRPAETAATLGEILVSACYVANWHSFHQVPMRYLGHTWSLCIEEQFYLVWPLLLFGLLRLRVGRRWVLALVCLGILASAGHRAWWIAHGPALGEPEYRATFMRLYSGSDTRADALLVGCLVGLLASWGMLPRLQKMWPLVWVAAVWAVCILGKWVYRHEPDWPTFYRGGFTVVALACAALLVCLLTSPLPGLKRLLEFGPLVGVGRISYGLYLFHNLIIEFALPPGREPYVPPAQMLMILGLSFAAAGLSYWLVERPFLRLKDRLGRGNPPAPTEGQAAPSKAA